MLVLARKESQSIIIGDNIEITVLSIKGDHVKIGIKAPLDIKVYRKEIFEEIQAANIQASQSKPVDLSNIDNLFKKEKEDKKEKS